MAEIAKLGIEVDTSAITAVTEALADLEKAADRANAAIRRFQAKGAVLTAVMMPVTDGDNVVRLKAARSEED